MTVENQEMPKHALIDCGAIGIALTYLDYSCHHPIQYQELREKREVEVIDWRPIKSRDITHIAKAGLKIQDHKDQLLMSITKLWHYQVVLRIPWLQLNDIAISCTSNTITFDSQFCITHCYNALLTVQDVSEESPEPVDPVMADILEPQLWPQRPFQGNIVMFNRALFFRTVKKRILILLTDSLCDIDKAIEAKDFCVTTPGWDCWKAVSWLSTMI